MRVFGITINIEMTANLATTYFQTIKTLPASILEYLSPKQSVRIGSISDSVKIASSQICANLTFRLWKTTAIFNKSLALKEGEDYLKILQIVTADKEPTVDEKTLLTAFFSGTETLNYLDKFDQFAALSHDAFFLSNHEQLKNLFNLCNSQFFDSFRAKLQGLTEIQDLNTIEPLPEEEKISVKDYNLLLSIKPALEMIQKLNLELDEVKGKLEDIQKIAEHPFFDELKHLCLENRPAGTIFLGNRHTLKVLNGQNFGFMSAMEQLFMGNACHIGIFVKKEGGLHLSHVNRITKNHAVLLSRNPLFLPFSYAATLDIKSLLPSTLSNEQKEEMDACFHAEFERLAIEEHPELPLAGSRTHAYMLLTGHKTMTSQKLSDIDLPPSGTPTMCSSYVGIIFLKALQKVNETLAADGFQERLENPFGDYENLMNLDILRLVYHWKQLKVLKPLLLDEKLAKVVVSNSILN